ncbi:hypothetical protein MACH17_07660 [Phaeobacter inhibens]|nr:hypothetical protein MACH17_07660 [Phaeobacter inhibens]
MKARLVNMGDTRVWVSSFKPICAQLRTGKPLNLMLNTPTAKGARSVANRTPQILCRYMSRVDLRRDVCGVERPKPH